MGRNDDGSKYTELHFDITTNADASAAVLQPAGSKVARWENGPDAIEDGVAVQVRQSAKRKGWEVWCPYSTFAAMLFGCTVLVHNMCACVRVFACLSVYLSGLCLSVLEFVCFHILSHHYVCVSCAQIHVLIRDHAIRDHAIRHQNKN